MDGEQLPATDVDGLELCEQALAHWRAASLAVWVEAHIPGGADSMPFEREEADQAIAAIRKTRALVQRLLPYARAGAARLAEAFGSEEAARLLADIDRGELSPDVQRPLAGTDVVDVGDGRVSITLSRPVAEALWGQLVDVGEHLAAGRSLEPWRTDKVLLPLFQQLRDVLGHGGRIV